MYYTYHTERLSLRILTDTFAPQVLQFYLDNKEEFERLESARSERFYTPEYQKIALQYEYNQALQGKLYRFWIYEKQYESRIIGTVSVRNILKAPYSRCEIGYKIDKDHRRQGYAREALTLVRDIIFDDMRLHRIEAAVLTDNQASCALLESLGFVKEGYLYKYIEVNGSYQDHLLYAATCDRFFTGNQTVDASAER